MANCVRHRIDPEEFADWSGSWEPSFNAGPAAEILLELKPWLLEMNYSFGLIDMGTSPYFHFHDNALCAGIVF